jgi:uncharacterized membrane protein YedE/YeeE
MSAPSVSELARAVAGGALIGAAATLYWRANGRVAGVSGILRGALLGKGDRAVPLAFLLGLVIAGVGGAALVGPGALGGAARALGAPVLVAAGLLVGFGTRLGGGCTSGHGVCGLARLSRRSLAATLTFIATGALTVLVVSRFWPALGGS